MNKKLIAVAVASIVAAPAAYADEPTLEDRVAALEAPNVTVYGRIHNRISNSNSNTDLQTSGSRFGIKVSSDIGNGMTALGQYEWGTDTDDGADGPSTRIGYVGLSGGFGKVTVGHQWATYYKTIGGHMSPTWYIGLRPIGIQARTANSILYTNSLGPVTLLADVRSDDSQDGIGNGGAIGFSASPMEGLTLGAAHDSTEDGDDITGVMASTSFGAIGVTLAHEQVDDGMGENDESTSVHMSLSASDSLSLLVGYGTIDRGNSTMSPNTFMAGAYYALGGGLHLQAEYGSLDEDDGSDRTSRTVLGLRLEF